MWKPLASFPKRPLEPEELLPLFAPKVPARVERDPARAIAQVLAECEPQDVVLVTGSVYLIGEVYAYFLAQQGRAGLFPEARA